MEKTRNRILENLIIERLSSNLSVRSKIRNRKEIKEVIEESILPRYEIQTTRYSIRKKLTDIVKIVLEHHPYGISHGDLAKLLNINRKNLTKYINRLMEKQIIVRNNVTKDGPYIISPSFSDNNKYFFSIFYFREEMQWALKTNEEFALKEIAEIENILENDETNQLFEFANKIGAIFTYLCLFAMNPKNGISKYAKDEQEKDLLVMLWLKDMISKFCLDWLQDFTHVMPYSLKSISNIKSQEKNEKKYDEKIQELIPRNKKIKCMYNSEIIEELQKTLNNTYPNICSACDDANNFVYRNTSRNRIEKKTSVSNPITYDEYRHYASSQCDHVIPFNVTDYATYNRKSQKIPNPQIKHCQKCHSFFNEPHMLSYEQNLRYKAYKEKTVRLCSHPELMEPSHNPFNHEFIRHCRWCHKSFFDRKEIN